MANKLNRCALSFARRILRIKFERAAASSCDSRTSFLRISYVDTCEQTEVDFVDFFF